MLGRLRSSRSACRVAPARLLDSQTDSCPQPADPATEQRRRKADAADRQRRIDFARDMWQSALPAHGTIVERDLPARGITILVPPTIRFIGMHTPYAWHPASGQRRPVMVAADEHVEHGLVGVSRTFLAIDGSCCKATLDPPRLFTGAIVGGAVRLGELRPIAPLVIAEGIDPRWRHRNCRDGRHGLRCRPTASSGWCCLPRRGTS